ncbi:MAG TPA: hypothetical protein VKD22_13295 [Ramlibacter sp.]|nr:hypothetical protein [Ramlibacter sp.]
MHGVRSRVLFVPESHDAVVAALIVVCLIGTAARWASRSPGVVLVMIMAVFVLLTWLLVTPPS